MIVAIYGSLTILFLFRKKNDKVVVTAFIQEIPKLVKENDGVRCNGLEKKIRPKISMNCHG